MIKRLFAKVIDRLTIWPSVQIGLCILSAVLLATALSQFFVPVDSAPQDNSADTSELTASQQITIPLTGRKDMTKQQIAYRPGMFEPAAGLADKPIANKTIERIKGQLKLQCVMEMNGQPTAYINIQGVGLRKCAVGDNVNDLFTVLDINQQNKSVDITIVQHKVTLHL